MTHYRIHQHGTHLTGRRGTPTVQGWTAGIVQAAPSRETIVEFYSGYIAAVGRSRQTVAAWALIVSARIGSDVRLRAAKPHGFRGCHHMGNIRPRVRLVRCIIQTVGAVAGETLLPDFFVRVRRRVAALTTRIHRAQYAAPAVSDAATANAGLIPTRGG